LKNRRKVNNTTTLLSIYRNDLHSHLFSFYLFIFIYASKIGPTRILSRTFVDVVIALCWVLVSAIKYSVTGCRNKKNRKT